MFFRTIRRKSSLKLDQVVDAEYPLRDRLKASEVQDLVDMCALLPLWTKADERVVQVRPEQ